MPRRSPDFARRGLAALAAFGLLASSASAGALELKKKAGSYDVELRIDRNPPVVGDNGLELRILDAGGAILKDADVLVNYYMPPMPRMAPMNYKTQAKLKKDVYAIRMRLIMAGPWVIVVKITAGGKTTSARFHIDAR
jgi:YtkA-like